MSSTFRMPDTNASGQKPKKECYTFEPQQWRKSVCKNCFRTQPEHTPKPPEGTVLTTSGGHTRSTNRSKNANQQTAPGPESQKPSTQPQSAAQGLFSSASSIDARYVEELENDFFELEDKFDNINREKEELSNELTTKLHQIDELQVLIEQYKEKVQSLERRCSHLEEEVKSYRERLRLPESDQAVSGDVVKSSTPIDLSPSTVRGSGFAIDIQTASKEELKKRITYMEQMCHEVAEENDLLKEEIEEMQREIEEMHDHFQEEGRDTMREMQRDLEATNKTCRILQFKLRKAERRFDQCESERANLEERLARLEAELYSEADVAHIRSIEEELRVAKEVGVRLNSELDMLDEKRAFYEEENRQLKEDIQIAHNRRTFLENELGRLKLETEKLKLEAGSGPLQVTDKNRSRLTKEVSLSKKPSFEEQELQRELDATKEREVDLSEQLRYAEDEATKLKRRLQDASADNDELSRRLDRLMNATLSSSKPSTRSLSPKTTASTTNLLIEKGKTLEDDPVKMKEYIELLKNQLLQVESEHDRLELETKNLKAIAQSVVENNKSLRMIAPKDSAAVADVSATEYQMQRDRLKEWCRRLNHIERDINLISKIDKEHNWLEKYNDAKEIIADLEDEKLKCQKQMTDLQNENSFLKSQQRKFDQSQRRERDRITSKDNTAKMSNDLLAQEISNLEEELDDVTSELVTAREQANSLTLQNNNLTNSLNDFRQEASKRERELINYMNSQDIKISALVSLNGLIKQRSDDLQAKFDRLEAFTEGKKSPADNEIEDLRLKIKTLESQLKEASKLNELADTLKKPNVEVDLSDSAHKNKEINLLKKELEEKDEILEENSMTIRELNVKMDNLWKMNDALKSLVDTEEETKESKNNRMEIKQANIEVKQANLEANCLKKEMESLKKDNYNLAQKILGLEKVRESLTKENCELQEEIKLREDSVFEQDDELQKKTNEIRHLKNQIETITREFELTKENLAEAKRRETAGTSGRLGAQIAENERLRAELNNTVRELKASNQKCTDQASSMREAKEKVEAIRSEMDRSSQMMREKDSIVIDLNKQIRALNGDLHGCQSELKLANEKLESKENQLKIVQDKFSANEKQIKELNEKIEEFKAEKEKEIIIPSSQASTVTLPPNSGTIGRRSEIERLKRELLSVKKDRDAIIKDAKRERIHLEQKVSALMERQREVERGSMTNLSGSILNLATGDAYTRALATQATATKIALLNEHVMRQNRYAMELKVQNESLHNSVLDYQRKYRSLKEQYEAEQEAWLTERVMLESMSREQEDRRTALANTKRTIQQMNIQLSEQEAEWFQQKMEFDEKIAKLEKENNTFKSKIVTMEEQQKLPKVLQRFGTTSAGRMNNPITNVGNGSSAMQADLQRRLEISERSMQRLRSECAERFDQRSKEHTQLINRYEHQRIELEREIELLKEQLIDMETFRQQAELFCQRQREVEEIADREFKLWSEEREQLMAKSEDAKICVDQWYHRLFNRKNSEVQNPDDIVTEVTNDMDKWRNAKPKQYIKRRDNFDSISQGMSPGMMGSKFESFDQMNNCGSVPASPVPNWNRGLLSYSQLSAAQRSTSMEWFNKMNSQSGLAGSSNGGPGSLLSQSVYKGSALSLIGHSNGQSGLAASANYASLQRCGRSVSPDISVKKVTNYPDPSGGFLLRSQSRQASTESLNSDYTGRAFTLPGKPSQKLPISPARRKFFDNEEPGQIPQGPKETPYDLMTKSMTKQKESSTIKVEVTPKTNGSFNSLSQTPAKDSKKSEKEEKKQPVKAKEPVQTSKSKSPFSLGKSSSTLNLKPSAASKANSFVNKLSSKFSTSRSSLAVTSTDSSGKPPSAPSKNSKASSVEPEKKQSFLSRSKEPEKVPPPKKNEVEKPKNQSVKPLVTEPSKIIRSSSTLTNKSTTPSTSSSSNGVSETSKTTTTFKAPSTTTQSDSRRSSRSGSVSGISPSIMHLRQKFSGGAAGKK